MDPSGAVCRVNMGTGIVSILLHNLPYNGRWLYWLSIVIFCLNVLLFCVFLIISVLRYSIWPDIWMKMIRHPVQSLFLGTFPMGFATIINMIAFVCVPAFGSHWALFAWALWWLDAAISVAVCFFLPFIIMNVHKETQLSSMTAVWLLPIVSTIVAAATGAIVAEKLEPTHPTYALWTLIVCYILWGTGVPTAMTVLVIYFHRLTVHSLPPREAIVSVFLPLGPLGQGAFAVQQMGVVARNVIPRAGVLADASISGMASTQAGEVLYVLGFVLGLVMWGYGLVWLFFAISSISRSRFPFNMGWWGFTFPLGVFTTATTQFGKDMPSTFFSALGTAFSVAVTLMWLGVAVLTLKHTFTGQLLHAPCLGSNTPGISCRDEDKSDEDHKETFTAA